MSDNDKKAVRPKAQAYSNAIMEVREIALELKKAILLASHARIELQTELQNDPSVKIMAMDSGDIEVMEFEIASVYGKTRHMHKLANDLGRRLNEPMPSNPKYDAEYQHLYTEEVSIRLSAPARR